MDFKVIFRDSFIADLCRIVSRIAAQNPSAARDLGLTIIRLSESLAFFPERYPRVHQRPHLRRFVAKKNFKIFYRIKEEEKVVEVLRCWDGRRGKDPHMER